ncbi:portal protein [Mycobacterium phage Anthony]|uniref:Portal protein n=1 Tax=Mycobacterium phage Anthony TaxID=2599857 RepID=A0A5J6TK45_9CAUD|nr:portal protein [Mycobacterium phage Anthony]QFG10384.1 portal protein [Mycobacterium phage Anthony]
MTAPIPVEASSASPEEQRDEMISLFEDKTRELSSNTSYYNAERRPEAIGVTVPREMQVLQAHIGYPRLYVDSIAERQQLEGFRLGDADEADQELWQWWQANNLDIEAPLGHTEAFIHGRAYITVSAPDPAGDPNWDPKIPIITVEPPSSMYASIDPRTKQVTKAIRCVYDDEGSEIIASTLYLPDATTAWYKQEGEWAPWFNVNHGLQMVPVIPLANRTTLSDIYGTTEITPELRSMTDAASRIMMLMQATAELMGVPQRLIFGVKPEELGVNPDTGQALFDAYLARILAFEDENGKIAQFSAAELRNFTEALQEIAKGVASYTGLPPQYLSTSADNPASAEAIRASESRLVKKVERKNSIFGGSWEQTMRVAKLVMGGGKLTPDFQRMETIWRDPSTPTYAAKADAAAKLVGTVIPRERARVDMGYSVAERTEMRRWDEEEAALGLGMMGTAFDADPTAGGGTAKPTAAKSNTTPKEAPTE